MNYGYLCEDVAHEKFIDLALESLIKAKGVKCKEFVKDEKFYNEIRIPSSSRTYVIRNSPTSAKLGFSKYGLDLFIEVFDYDDYSIDEFNHYYQQLKDKFEHKIKRKCVIAIPVQAIEYWLWYLKNKEANPQPSSKEQEAIFNRKLCKESVYGKAEPTKDETVKMVEQVMNSFDAKWLESKSESFAHFYEQLKEFCRTYE